LLMTHSHAQIHCCHWDLGRFEGVCGEAAGGVMCDRLLGRAEVDPVMPRQSRGNAAAPAAAGKSRSCPFPQTATLDICSQMGKAPAEGLSGD
jgi:hypothetical protein